LLFLDDDMAWQPEAIIRMVEFNLDVVGIPYRQKNPEIQFNMRIADNKYQQSVNNPALFKVHDIATGLMLIKRTVFEVLRDKVDYVVDHHTGMNVGMFFRHNVVQDEIARPDGGHSYMSEDFFFCRRARESGFEIWAYVDAETGHTGTVTFKGNYADVVKCCAGIDCRDSIEKKPLQLGGALA